MIAYRVTILQLYSAINGMPFIKKYAKLIAASGGSVINLIVISVLDIGKDR